MTVLAYLDPVTGSALLQAVHAALAAIGLGWQYVRKATRTVWNALRGDGETVPTDGADMETVDTETQRS